jgi:hypothetical protein
MASSFRGYGCNLMLPSMGVSWITTPGAFGGYVPVAACTGTVIGRDLFFRLGGYDESLPLYGAAEPEFSVRAWLGGCEIVNVSELLVGHRFRPKPQYRRFIDTNSLTLIKNYIRFACYYLPEDILIRSFEHYLRVIPANFHLVLRELGEQGVWAHRTFLKASLPRPFHWLAQKFALA